MPHDDDAKSEAKKAVDQAQDVEEWSAEKFARFYDKFVYTDAIGLILYPSDDEDAEIFDLS